MQAFNKLNGSIQRSHLFGRQRSFSDCTHVQKRWRAESYDQDNETRLLEEDMQRMSQRQQASRPQSSKQDVSGNEFELEKQGPSSGAKELLDKVGDKFGHSSFQFDTHYFCTHGKRVTVSATSPCGARTHYTVLIADFFFVFLALLGLGAGVAESSFLHTKTLLDIWYPLWNSVFQPAIGVLMLGALASGGLGWLSKRKEA